MANKSVLGRQVYIKELKKIGVISKTDDQDKPLEVIIDGEIIEVVNLTVKLIGLFKALFLLVKSIFVK